MLLVVIWIVATISTTLAFCRFFTRLRIIKAAGKDDTALALSVVRSTTLCRLQAYLTKAQVMNLIAQIFCTVSAHYGIGRHLVTLPPQDAMEAIRLTNITDPFGIMAFCIPKLAVALLLGRIMTPVQRGRWFLYSMTGGVMIAGILDVIFLFVQCKPVAALWDPIVAATATCWNPSVIVNYGYFLGGPSPPSKLWFPILIRKKRTPPSVISCWLFSLYLSCGTSKCP